MTGSSLTRRGLLRGIGVGAAVGAGALSTASCTLFGSGPSSTSSNGTVTLTVAIVPDPSGASQFYAEQFAAFTKKTGINVKIIENPTDQQLNAIELMFQQGNPPDVFRCQGAEALNRISSRGWIAALDEQAGASDLAARFPAGALDPRTSGLHRDGKLLSLPLVSGQWSAGGFLVYNKSLLSEGGYAEPPKTVGEYETYARSLTGKGSGKFYGAALSGAKPADITALQAQAGPAGIGGLGIDYRTGKAAFDDASLVDAVEFVRKLQADKIYQPGWESWDGARVFTEFAKGKIGFYIGGGWNVNEIAKLNPDLDFGVSTVPVPDAGRKGYYGQSSAFAPLWSMSAESKHPEESWKLMDFLVSEEFQRAYFAKFRTFTAMESAWRDASDLSEQEKGIIAAFDASIRHAPGPSTDGSPGVQKLLAAKSAKPDLAHTDSSLQSITRNEDFAPKTATLNKNLDAFLDAEIKKLTGEGIEVSRDDLVYAGYDPLKDWKPA